MSHVAHELTAELPDRVEEIARLRQINGHFARLAERYHELNRTIHRMNAGITPVSDETLEQAKKERLALLDEIVAMLDAAKV